MGPAIPGVELQIAGDAVDRLRQLTLVIWLVKASNRNLGGARVRVPGREQSRDSALLRCLRQLDPVLVAAQADVAEDQVDRLALDDLERMVELVGRGDDLIAGVAEDIFIVERR